MMNINCYAAYNSSEALQPFDFAPRPVADQEVVVTVSHCGICHTDLHLIDNDWGVSQYPLVPGHEIVGEVYEVGKAVKHLKIGQRVGIGWQCGCCQKCEWCLKGDENLCPDVRATCLSQYGGFANRVYAHARFVFPIPDQLASENAAPLLCGGITVYAPLRFHQVRPHMHVGIIGAGGLGHLAIQFARAFDCEVTVFSSTPSKEAEVKELGAQHFVINNHIDELTSMQNSLDFIISTVHVDLDWTSYIDLLKPDGKLCFVGVPASNISIPVLSLLRGRKSIVSSPIGSPEYIHDMLNISARNGIKAKVETLPFSEINTALQRVRDNQVRYRMVLEY